MRNTILVSLVALFSVSATASFDSSHHAGLHRAASHLARSARNPSVLKRSGASKQGRCAAIASTSLTPSSTTSSAAQTTTPAPVAEVQVDSEPTTTTHKTTTTKEAPPPAKTTAKAESSDNSGGGGGQTFPGGDLTFYTPGLNACGTVDSYGSMIAAIAHARWDTWPGFNGNSNEHPLCHKPITVTWQGKSVGVTITDRCGGCDIENSVDLSPDAFAAVADPNLGRVHDASWQLD